MLTITEGGELVAGYVTREALGNKQSFCGIELKCCLGFSGICVTLIVLGNPHIELFMEFCSWQIFF